LLLPPPRVTAPPATSGRSRTDRVVDSICLAINTEEQPPSTRSEEAGRRGRRGTGAATARTGVATRHGRCRRREYHDASIDDAATDDRELNHDVEPARVASPRPRLASYHTLPSYETSVSHPSKHPPCPLSVR
jgi:hypothetical protein